MQGISGLEIIELDMVSSDLFSHVGAYRMTSAPYVLRAVFYGDGSGRRG
jgi:hypothetical protein